MCNSNKILIEKDNISYIMSKCKNKFKYNNCLFILLSEKRIDKLHDSKMIF